MADIPHVKTMKKSTALTLKKSEMEPVIADLKQLLADYQIYYANLRGFHWHIRGPQFFTLHKQLEKLYIDAANKADMLAERLLMLGDTPDSKFSDYIAAAHIKEVDGVSDGRKAAEHILDSLHHLIDYQRGVAEKADEAHDIGTADMLTLFIEDQEKYVWMFSAYMDK